MKIKYSAMDQNFMEAFRFLSDQPLEPKLSYSLVKLAAEIEKASNKINKEFQEELKAKFGEELKDENKEEFMAFRKAFGEREFELTRPPIGVHQLVNSSQLKIAPKYLAALEPILVDVSAAS